MEILIKLAQYHDSKGNLRESDYVDNLILRMAKSEDGEDLIEGVEWKNPNLDPEKLQAMERNIYPEGFHLYTDVDIPTSKALVEYLPKEQRTLQNLSENFELNPEQSKKVRELEAQQVALMEKIKTLFQ